MTVAAVHELTFGVNTNGRTGEATTVVKDAESLSISMGGKRNYGDPGNDYVAGLAFKTGNDCNSVFSINFPDGGKLVMDCVINVTSLGGDSTAVDALEWEVLSDGKPTYTEPSKS